MLGDPEGSLGLGVLLPLGFSGFSGWGAFCFVGNGLVLLKMLAGMREWHLGRFYLLFEWGWPRFYISSCVPCTRIKLSHTTCYIIKLLGNR